MTDSAYTGIILLLFAIRHATDNLYRIPSEAIPFLNQMTMSVIVCFRGNQSTAYLVLTQLGLICAFQGRWISFLDRLKVPYADLIARIIYYPEPLPDKFDKNPRLTAIVEQVKNFRQLLTEATAILWRDNVTKAWVSHFDWDECWKEVSFDTKKPMTGSRALSQLRDSRGVSKRIWAIK